MNPRNKRTTRGTPLLSPLLPPASVSSPSFAAHDPVARCRRHLCYHDDAFLHCDDNYHDCRACPSACLRRTVVNMSKKDEPSRKYMYSNTWSNSIFLYV